MVEKEEALRMREAAVALETNADRDGAPSFAAPATGRTNRCGLAEGGRRNAFEAVRTLRWTADMVRPRRQQRQWLEEGIAEQKKIRDEGKIYLK